MKEQFSMSVNLRYLVGKKLSQLSFYPLKVLPTGGKSFPGLFFIKFAGRQSINNLSKDQTDIGSVLITGTNGKTTTTSMIVELLSQELELSTSYGNNTVFSLTTSLLEKKSRLGIFEYGIRDIEHGTPQQVCQVLEPIGVVYTNISREHTQVAGVKNPYENYVKAKSLLSGCMKNGILIANADDPNTVFIGHNRQQDNHVVYFGLELDDYESIFEENEIPCPNCNGYLEYSVHYINQRGKYQCSCGFKRPQPDVKITRLTQNGDGILLSIEADAYNYHKNDNIRYSVDLKLPSIGIHNIYNTLTAIAIYTAFTPSENIENNIKSFFENYRYTVPPGRFEILKLEDKTIGVGQGDNGDALKINSQLMRENIDGEVEFIYTTPDDNEEEIFEDHSQSIKALDPVKLIVLPGRKSTDASNRYYNQIKDEYDSEYYGIEFDFEQRINKILELIENSKCNNIIISGCGEEIVFWEVLKNRIKEEYGIKTN